MTTTLKAKYAAAVAFATMTASNNLASAGAAGIAAIDNTGNLYLDAMVKILVPVGAVAAPKYINVWFSGSEDGTDYLSNSATTDAYAGADGAITLGAPPLFIGPWPTNTQQASVTVKILIPSICKAFGMLILPRKWGLIIENQTGVAFNGQPSGEYSGINLDNV